MNRLKLDLDGIRVATFEADAVPCIAAGVDASGYSCGPIRCPPAPYSYNTNC